MIPPVVLCADGWEPGRGFLEGETEREGTGEGTRTVEGEEEESLDDKNAEEAILMLPERVNATSGGLQRFTVLWDLFKTSFNKEAVEFVGLFTLLLVVLLHELEVSLLEGGERERGEEGGTDSEDGSWTISFNCLQRGR